MRSTKIVTSFLCNNDRLLLLKRSNKVKTMKGLWAGISGIIENNEEPLTRAKIEIFEEVGIKEEEIHLLKSSDEIAIVSPQYENHEWRIYPFLFEVKNTNVHLNWENSDYRWIKPGEISNFETVPSLDRVLLNLL